MSNIESNLKKLLRGVKACSPGEYLKVPMFRKNLPPEMKPGKGVMLGQGEYGKVYRGSVNDNGRRYVAYKEIDTERNNLGMAEFEFKVAKKLKGYGVPDMYLYKKCKGLDILYLEYIEGEELQKWWKTEPSMEAMKSVMAQVLYNLYKIKEKFPGFRHHDLHGGNILVRPVTRKDITIKLPNKTYKIPNGGVEAVMIDFGLSSFPKITNPSIEDGSYKHVGISKKSHPLYDLHLFLNTVFTFVKYPQDKEERQIHNFIKSLIPDGHLGMENTYVTFYRLGPNFNQQHTKALPSFEKVLSRSFFTGELKTALNMIPKPKPKTKPIAPVSRARVKTPSPKLSTVEKKNAIKRAAAILAGNKTKPKPVQRRPGVARPVQKVATPVRPKETFSFIDKSGKKREFVRKSAYKKALANNKAQKLVNSLSNNEIAILKKKICQP